MTARKKVLIPTFLLHPDADALLQNADDVEVIYGLDEAERAIGLGGTDRFVPSATPAVKAALEQYLGEVHALHAMGPGGHLPVTAEMLATGGRYLEVVFISAAGTDKIDVADRHRARGTGHQCGGRKCARGRRTRRRD